MKKLSISLIACLIGIVTFAQEKNGTVFSEHENIQITKKLWVDLVNGDKEAFINHFADSVFVLWNGVVNNNSKRPRENMGGWINYYSQFENLKIEDAKPAFPDAIDYKKGGVWVQDWLKFTGIHKETGIVLDQPIHHLYSFNDENKITSLHIYGDLGFNEEINNSRTTRENGTVYINHPYIVAVRKILNAVQAKDLDTWASFFDENARFGFGAGSYDLETAKRKTQELYDKGVVFKFKQVGYPDCVHYEQGDSWVVYYWCSNVEMVDNQKKEVVYLFSHNFNKEGKVTGASLYKNSDL